MTKSSTTKRLSSSVNGSLDSNIDSDTRRSRRKLSAKKTLENDIPPSPHYQVSYAHRAVVTFTKYSSKYDMILTASQDGIVKFWKRTPSSSLPRLKKGSGGNTISNFSTPIEQTGRCIEFVKSYVAHTSHIQVLVTSQPDGDSAASIGGDNTIKFYDVGGFDVTGMIKVSNGNDTRSIVCGNSAAFIGEQQYLLAVSSSVETGSTKGAGDIFIFSSITLSPSPLQIISLHSSPITSMAYNFQYHCMISTDRRGILEYWNGSIMLASSLFTGDKTEYIASQESSEYETISTDDKKSTIEANGHPGNNYDMADNSVVSEEAYKSLGTLPTKSRNGISFNSKLNDTDLYSLLRKKTHAICLAVSPSGTLFCIYGADRKVRIFDYKTGKITVQYDERMKVYDAMVQRQQKQLAANNGNDDLIGSNSNGMDAIDYGKRAATEREMSETFILNKTERTKISTQECGYQSLMVQFDSTGKYILLPTILGIKAIHLPTNRSNIIVGKGDASGLRFLGGCICLGNAKVDQQMMLARTGGNSDAKSNDNHHSKMSDSILISMAYKKRRLYVFSHLDPIENSETNGENNESAAEDQQDAIIARDVLNEPPEDDELMLHGVEGKGLNEESTSGKEAILRTSMGDIHIRLFPEETPRTIENFCGHARSGYYDNVSSETEIVTLWLRCGKSLSLSNYVLCK